MQASRVLIVGNDIFTANLIEDELRQAQIESIVRADSCEEAISKAEELRPDLILMDVCLGEEVDGIEAAEIILKFNDAPVVFITSSSEKRVISRLMKIDPNGFIIKPFDGRILLSAIDIAIYRHKSKKELFEAKEIFRTTLESIDDIVISLDKSGIITHIHSNIKSEISEVINFEKLEGNSFSELFPEKISRILNKGFSKSIQTEQPQEFEFGLPFDNPTHYFNIKSSVRKNLHKEISGITVVIRDVTSKVIWAETLRKFSTAVEQSANIVIIFSKEGFVEFVNNKYVETSGFTYEDNIGKRFQNFNPIKNNEQLLDEIWEHILEGKVWEGEWENQRKDKTNYWEHVTISPIKNDEGVLTNFLFVSEDVTQKRFIQHELISSRERLEEAQQIAGLGTCEINFQKKKILFNKTFSQILGIRDEDFHGFNDENFLNIIHAEDRNRYKNYREDIISKKKNRFSIEYRVIDKTNNVKYIHSIGKIEYAESGNAHKMFITIQDVSLQKQSEQLRQDIEIARKTADIKQQFFANISHEIRNPLSSIVGLSDLLLKSDISHDHMQMCKTIMASADSIMSLINDILDISRIEAGKMSLTPEHFSIYSLLESVKLIFEPQAEAKGLSIVYDIPDNLPTDIISDDKRIMQVITNLMTNAIKFTENGSVWFNVSLVEKIADDDYIIKIEVMDSGIGIQESDLPKLFKSFSQIHSNITKKAMGSGLGLAISKHLVDLLRGEIGVESLPGKGSKFWFTFRSMLISDIFDNKQEEQQMEEFIQGLDIHEIQGSSILLVEDKVVNQKVMTLMLEKLGCKVSIANNGKQAIELFQESEVNAFDIFGKIRYDLILMDVNMPEMSGTEAARLLTSHFKNIPPIIGLTANVDTDDIIAYKESGMDDVIAKPVKLEVLEKKLSYWLAVNREKVLNQELANTDAVDIDNLPVLNPNTLKAISKQVKESDFNLAELFKSFINDMEDIYKRWIHAIEMNDYHSLKTVVTTVKGLSGNFGASQMHETARLIDKYLKSGQNQKAASMMPLLAQRYEAFKKHITVNYLNKSKEYKPGNSKREG